VSDSAGTQPAGRAKIEDFDDAVAYLESLRPGDIHPGLERIAWLCERLGHPERALPFIHVTGTNGKGSTSRLAAAVLTATGRRTGLFTSPHLEVITERIAIDGVAITEAEFTELTVRLATELEAAVADRPGAPTHFELLTALGFAAFADADLDALVLEVGLGGRLDATNVVDGQVAVITNIALDHTDALGATRELIATEKAGIVKPGAVAVLGEQDPAVRAVLEDRCAQVGATPWRLGEEFALLENVAHPRGRRITVVTPTGRYEDLVVPFHGAHQGRNAACALAALDGFLGRAPEQDLVAGAFGAAANPGRFELIAGSPPLVIDVAHNPHGAAALVETLDEVFPGRERVLVVGINPHKQAEEMLAVMLTGTRAVVTTQVFDAPAIPATALARMAESLGHRLVRAAPDSRQAVDLALELARPDDVIVCTGSHYWIGTVRGYLQERRAES